uniref:Uncharacterized protein n=1 Tax=Manihot esculenta TaxID=3983 RepID=A0A2C9WNV0_MANES
MQTSAGQLLEVQVRTPSTEDVSLNAGNGPKLNLLLAYGCDGPSVIKFEHQLQLGPRSENLCL